VVDVPETKFANVGDERIAYQVFGDGRLDLVHLMPTGVAVDVVWEYPPLVGLFERLASFSRVVMFDPRGRGSSDATPGETFASWEYWADDAAAVLDAIGSQRAALLAVVDGGPTAIMFAATRPERTRALVLVNTTARFLKDDDYPWGFTEAEADATEQFLIEQWGTEAQAAYWNPDLASDTSYLRWFTKAQRVCLRPREAASYLRWVSRTDVREVLSAVRAPTLVLNRKELPIVGVEHGRYLAEHIPGARFVCLEGANAGPVDWFDTEALDHIEGFLRRFAGPVDSRRALAAVLFTDIVGSTKQAVELGDRRWRELLDSHDVVMRTVIDQHRGRLVKLTGDGALASFDGPGRAIACAFALHDALEPLGIQIRAGLHTGEIELRGDDIGGIAVHIAERVHTFAQPGEVLVSETVPRLVTGSGIEFEDRGEHELKGVPGNWRLYSVIP
jgi:class 3 adenylate cyclase/pimeloyl-ACP methyl ester carboxylesterase